MDLERRDQIESEMLLDIDLMATAVAEWGDSEDLNELQSVELLLLIRNGLRSHRTLAGASPLHGNTGVLEGARAFYVRLRANQLGFNLNYLSASSDALLRQELESEAGWKLDAFSKVLRKLPQLQRVRDAVAGVLMGREEIAAAHRGGAMFS